MVTVNDNLKPAQWIDMVNDPLQTESDIVELFALVETLKAKQNAN